MKGIRASRIKIKVGETWESPGLHVLLTKEDEVIVARCLDFTVSSHGKDVDDALNSLADAIKEYILSAVENNSVESLFDPAHGSYWRLYNELEVKHTVGKMKNSLKYSMTEFSRKKIKDSVAEIIYA